MTNQEQITRIVNQVRFYLEANHIGRFHLQIEAEGDTDDSGTTRIEYKLAKYSYTADAVRGNDLKPVIEEFIRRHGWQERHDAVLLPNHSRSDLALEEQFSEEVPF